MKKLFFLAMMLMGTFAAQAQDVLVSVYDLDKTAVEDEAIAGKQTVETKTTIVQPLELNTTVSADDVMEVTSEVALDKVVVAKVEGGEVLRTIDLAKAKQATLDLKQFGDTKITVTFYGEDGRTTGYTWE